MQKKDIIFEIQRLKEEKNAIILAHYYSLPEVQDIADFLGDSLALSRQAAETEADTILFCGVHFMAETAAIISPQKKVLTPTRYAGCSLAEGASAAGLKEWKDKNPDGVIVSYVNTTAEVKAYTDYCCTSSNALKVIKSIPADKKILFGPDRNLGAYIIEATGRKMELWNAACFVHDRIDEESLLEALELHPYADLLIHPESAGAASKAILNSPRAFAYSTSGILEHAKKSDKKQFIIATEPEILHQLRKASPDKEFLAIQPNNRCHYMKQGGLWEVYEALKNKAYVVVVPEDIRKRAILSIERMLAIG